MDPRERIIIALDLSFDDAVAVVDKLGDSASFYKVGLSLYLEKGPRIIELLFKKGKKVFLDLKFHDIPHQVYLAARQAAESGVYFLTVHASGGTPMVEAARQALDGTETRLLAVTVLTSISSSELKVIGYSQDAVSRLAKLAFDAGADGVVISGKDLKSLRAGYPGKIFVVPGIRPSFQVVSSDDQKRIITPVEAFDAGADYIVIGRPVVLNSSPEIVLEKIIREIESLGEKFF